MSPIPKEFKEINEKKITCKNLEECDLFINLAGHRSNQFVMKIITVSPLIFNYNDNKSLNTLTSD